ncbi:MAG: ABC transporter permease [Candidatus Aminicenantales bacterium]
MVWIYIKLAWRNLFRNKRRSFIAGTAIGIGLASLIFVDALIVGMERNMIHSATASFLGEGQIHREGFRETQSVEQTINRLDWVLSQLEKEAIVENYTSRVTSFAMISSASNMSAIQLVGIQPETERYLSQIDEAIREGDFFRKEDKRSIIIGSKLAEILEVELGDRRSCTGDVSCVRNLSFQHQRDGQRHGFCAAQKSPGPARPGRGSA